MFSIDNRHYQTPVRVMRDGTFRTWKIYHNSGSMTEAQELNFTLQPSSSAYGFKIEDKLTLTFRKDGTVAASARTLRKFGNNSLAPLISRAVNRMENEETSAPSLGSSTGSINQEYARMILGLDPWCD